MNIKHILVIIAIFTFHTMKSQTYIQNNIQEHLVNKKWSHNAGNKKITFLYKDTGVFHLYIDNTEIGTENYYVTTVSDCGTNPVSFDNSKIGQISQGNYIKTFRECFIIEIQSDYQKIRLKRAFSSKWIIYYLD